MLYHYYNNYKNSGKVNFDLSVTYLLTGTEWDDNLKQDVYKVSTEFILVIFFKDLKVLDIYGMLYSQKLLRFLHLLILFFYCLFLFKSLIVKNKFIGLYLVIKGHKEMLVLIFPSFLSIFFPSFPETDVHQPQIWGYR